LRKLKDLQRGELAVPDQGEDSTAAPEPDQRVADLRELLGSGIFCFWNDRQCRMAGKSFEARCGALLRLCDDRKIPLSAEQRLALQQDMNGGS
jgi:hypothetical protein